ncbi:MAG TPA: hypothetical protein VL175_11310 [Pirellulales bacterium]|jgi:hypothetical protein|nr:hypothetical protein [Pirellulales bacterium]
MRTKVCLVRICSAFMLLGYAATVHAAWFTAGDDSSGKPDKKGESAINTATTNPMRLVANPMNIFKPKTVTTRKSGLTGVQKAKKTEQPKQGFFKSMFNPEPPPPPKTIKEWMSLKQIHP